MNQKAFMKILTLFLAFLIFTQTTFAQTNNTEVKSCLPIYEKVKNDDGAGFIIGSFSFIMGISVANAQILMITEEARGSVTALLVSLGVAVVGGVVMYFSKKQREKKLTQSMNIIESANSGVVNDDFKLFEIAVNKQLKETNNTEADTVEIADAVSKLDQSQDLCPVTKVDRRGVPRFGVFKLKGLAKLVAYRIVSSRALATF
jgi:hypothetical protein